MNKFTLKQVVLNAIIAATYFVLVWIFNWMSFSDIQFRIAEVLLILLIFNSKISVGLIIGTFIANLVFSPFGIVDALVGTLASILSIVSIIILRKRPLIALIMPALFNGLIVGLMITYLADLPEISLFLISFIGIFIGEFVVMYGLGYPLYRYLKKRDDIIEILNN